MSKLTFFEMELPLHVFYRAKTRKALVQKHGTEHPIRKVIVEFKDSYDLLMKVLPIDVPAVAVLTPSMAESKPTGGDIDLSGEGKPGKLEVPDAGTALLDDVLGKVRKPKSGDSGPPVLRKLFQIG